MSVLQNIQKTSTHTSGLPSTVAEMEEVLIECHDLWRRSPGAGRWPFAGDGPWHLIQGEAGDQAGDASATLMNTKSGKELEVRKVDAVRPRVALDRREVDERDRVTAWLQLLPEQMDRKLVWLATAQLHAGEARIPWSALCGWLGYVRTSKALAWRYRLAMGTMVCLIRGWPSRRARVLAQEYSASREED
ncbi:hypothetical protein ACRAQ6_14010 [Erythrobacter sp. HA6-11]